MSLTNKQIESILIRLNNGEKATSLAYEYGVSDSYISQLRHGKKSGRKVQLTVFEAKAICWAMNPSPKDGKWRDLLEERIAEAGGW